MSVKDVMLRRRGKIEVETSQIDENVKNTAYVASINANIQSLGYSLSEDLFRALETKEIEYLVKFNNWIVPELEKSVGADVEYNPMYPNFPKQVMQMDELELYMNAIMHYWNRDFHYAGFEDIMPEIYTELEKRFPALDLNKKVKQLDLGNEEDRFEVLDNLMKSSVAYSEQDKEDIRTFMLEERWKKHIPDRIGNRENFAYLMTQALDFNKYLPENFSMLSKVEQDNQKKKAMNKALKDAYALKPYCRNAMDALRVYVGLCGGDISLSDNTKFKALPRKERRFILSLFEDTENLASFMSMRPEEFKKAFQYLHVDEQRDENGNLLYPKTSEAINQIRDGIYEQSLLGKVQGEINNGNIEVASKLLTEEPGIFARKLDEMLRLSNNPDEVLESFSNVVTKVDPKILLTLREHFKGRTKERDFRVFFPKGNISKAYVKENDLEPISEELSAKIIAVCDNALIEKFKDKGDLGKVYISEELKGYKAPLVLRNLTAGSKTITRGSRIPIDKEKNTLRAFIWWRDDLDNDLSAVLFDENWNYSDHISYTYLKNKYGCHSGDITYQRDNGYDGECEFIDLNIEKAKKDGIRYIAFEVHNFSDIPFDKANCRFGFMEREQPFEYSERIGAMYPNTGEIFEPLTVEYVMNLTAQTTSMAPFIFDTETREVIWGDISISGKFEHNNIENSLPSATAACYSCVNNDTPSLYDVLYLNAMARGEITKNKEEADEIFSLDEGITPYDTDIIVSRFLGTDKDEQCKQYKIKEITENNQEIKNDNDEFVEEILGYAVEKSELSEKNKKAQDLLEAYENQLPKSQSEEYDY